MPDVLPDFVGLEEFALVEELNAGEVELFFFFGEHGKEVVINE